MAKGPPRELQVLAINDISPNMRRITLGGPALADFPRDQVGGYIKLFLKNPGQEGPAVRTYTVRSHREEENELDVDFVMHGDHGVASAWAMYTRVGDTVKVGGPGPKKIVDLAADWFFLVADMTALPALSVNLEALPKSATGYVVIEILDDNDRQELAAPPGVELHWVVATNPAAGREAVLACVREQAWLDGRAAIWAASEFDTMKALRQYFKKERRIPTSDAYISSYWKYGLREDEHKVIKKQDADAP